MFKNNKGFSLIEILVTVGLIGILVSIAVPSYNKYKKNTLEMAVKSDVGNGHKAYAAYDAVNGTYCASLDDVGVNVIMTTQTYRKQGAYGFGGINTDCGGDPHSSDTISFENTGYCQDTMTGQAVTSITTMASCSGTNQAWQADNEFSGTLTACVIGSDNFDLGAYTNTSALNTFVMVNEAGKVHRVTGDTCAVVP